MKATMYKGSAIVAGEFISNIPPDSIGRFMRYPRARSSPVGRTAWRYTIPEHDDKLQGMLEQHCFDDYYMEPNYLVRGQESPVVQRPNITLNVPRVEWWARNDGQVIDGVPGVAGIDIDTAEAWQTTTGSRNVAVAILDSGLHVTHPDLKANVWRSPQPMRLNLGGYALNCPKGIRGINCVSPATTPFDIADDHSHGTRLAGIVGASHAGGGCATGVNDLVTLIPIKVLNWQLYGTIESVVNGLDCVLQIAEFGLSDPMRLTIVLASWGFWAPTPSTLLQQKLDLLLEKNILVVCSAYNCLPDQNGNLDLPRNGLSYYLPAFPHSNLLAVTGSDHRDELIAGYGPRSIDLRAPGYAINSPTLANGCSEANGASMAAALTAGVAALVQSHCPDITAADLRSCLMAGASDPNGATVSGRLNAFGALQKAPGGSSGIVIPRSSPPVPPPPQPQPPAVAAEPIVPWKVEWEVEQTSDEYHDRPNQRQTSGGNGDVVKLELVNGKYHCRFRAAAESSYTFSSCSALAFDLIEKLDSTGATAWKQADFTPAEKSTVEYAKLADAIMQADYSYYRAEGMLQLRDTTTAPVKVLALFVPILVSVAGAQSPHFALVLVHVDEPWPPLNPLGMQGGVIHGSRPK